MYLQGFWGWGWEACSWEMQNALAQISKHRRERKKDEHTKSNKLNHEREIRKETAVDRTATQ